MNQTANADNLTLALRQMHRWRMAFFGLVILLAGLVIGAASTLMVVHGRLTAPPPGPQLDMKVLIRDLERALALSPEQADRIRPILDRHMRRFDDERADARLRITEQLRQMNDEILPLLHERQRQLWQDCIQRLQGQLRHVPRGPMGPGRGFRRGQEGFDKPAPPRSFPDNELRPPLEQ